MDRKQSGRRRFLKRSAALAGMAMGAIRSARGQNQSWTLGYEPGVPKDLREYGQPSRFAKVMRTYNPAVHRATDDVHTPLQDSMGIITPSSLHYTVSHGSAVPDIDPREHRLMIHGMVDRPLIFTMEELKRFPSVSRIHFIECAYNGSPPERKSPDATVERTHGQTSCSEWPFATQIWDFINRAMPPNFNNRPVPPNQRLTADEVYALTAFLLYQNGIIKEADVIDAKSLPKIQMPNRNGFVPSRLEDILDYRGKRACRSGTCP